MLAGGFLMYTGIGGPIGLGLIGAGADTIIQKATTGSVNWTQTALTAVTGGVGGGLAAARLSALGIKGAQATLAVNAASGASGGGAGNAYAYATSPGPHTAGEFVAATADGAFAGAALGATGGALGGGLSRAISRLTPKPDLFEYTLSKSILKYSTKLKNNGDFDRPYNEQRLVMQQIVEGGTKVPDINPRMTKFVAPGGFNGSSGNWELVVDKKNKLIVHYLYTSGSKK